MSPQIRIQSRAAQRAVRPRPLLLYAITAAQAQPNDTEAAPVRGVQDAPVSWIQEGAVAALVSELPSPHLLDTPSCADILTFDGVLEHFASVLTLLPVRYGTSASSETALRRLLRARGADYLHGLMEIDGCAEMCVRLLPGALSAVLEPGELAAARTAGDPSGGPGSDTGGRRARSLQTRRQQLDRVYALARRYLEHFAPWALRHRVDYSFRSYARESEPVLSLYFLIQRTATHAFQEACRALTELRPIRVLLSGPSPPLTFVPSLPMLADP